MLGICYGMQLVAHLLDGKVEHAARREYGRAEVERAGARPALRGPRFRRDRLDEPRRSRHAPAAPDSRRPRGRRTPPSSEWRTGSAASTASSSIPRCRTPCTARRFCTTSSSKPAVPRGDWTMASYLDEAAAAIRERTHGRESALRHLGRRRLGGDRGVAQARHRRRPGLGLRRHRTAAQGRALAGRGQPDRRTGDSDRDRRRRRGLSRRARWRDRPRGQAQGDRTRLHRRLPARGAQVRGREVPRPGDALSGRHRIDLGARAVGGHQVAPQRRRPARAPRLRARRALALAVQGRGAAARARARTAGGVHRPPSVPRPGPRGADPRRGDRGARSRSCRRPTPSSSPSSARAAGTTRSRRPSPSCCR